MKKVISMILILVTILVSSTYVLGATGKVTADTLNIRESASQSSKVIARIAKDQEVEILEDNGEWLKVKYRTYTGFVSSKFIAKNAETPKEEPKEETPVATENTTTETESKSEEKVEEKKEEKTQVVEEQKTQNTEYISNRDTKLKENVKVYSLPTLSSYTLGELNSGTELLVINSAGQWAYVQTDNISGWIKLAATEIEIVTTTPETPKEEPQIENKVEEPVAQNTVEETTKTEETTQTEEPKTEEPAQTTDNGSYPKTMYTNKDSVIIRYKPSKDSGILNSLKKGTKVKVTGKEGEWYKVSISGDTGYIYYTLLSDTNN